MHNGGLALHLEPYIELAMYYEHQEKNMQRALLFAEEALTRLWRRRTLNRRDKKQLESEKALQKRVDRLKKKQLATGRAKKSIVNQLSGTVLF